jgi:hypothetical protein
VKRRAHFTSNDLPTESAALERPLDAIVDIGGVFTVEVAPEWDVFEMYWLLDVGVDLSVCFFCFVSF